VDTYQYKLYYGADGLYEELNQYEKVDGDNYKFTSCDAYAKKGNDESEPDNHYEPTGEDIYAIKPCVAYDKGRQSEGRANIIYARIDDNGSKSSSSTTTDDLAMVEGETPRSLNQYESIFGGSKSSLNGNRMEVTASINEENEEEEGDMGYSTVEQTTGL